MQVRNAACKAARAQASEGSGAYVVLTLVESAKASEACELARALATTQHHRAGYRTHCLTREEPDNPLHERVLFGIVNEPLGLVCVVSLFVFVCAHLSQLAMPGV